MSTGLSTPFHLHIQDWPLRPAVEKAFLFYLRLSYSYRCFYEFRMDLDANILINENTKLPMVEYSDPYTVGSRRICQVCFRKIATLAKKHHNNRVLQAAY